MYARTLQYVHNYIHMHVFISVIIQGPSNVTYCINSGDLPIELTCTVSGVAAWIVNDTRYTLDKINQTLLGHDRNGTNMLIYTPVDGTKYICVSQSLDGQDVSNPVYITILGTWYENMHIINIYIYQYNYICNRVMPRNS